MSKLRYLARSIARLADGERFKCPNCGSSSSDVVDQKYVVTKLCRCHACRLQYRVPTDKAVDNPKFYESEYSQGFTTELPNFERLNELKNINFRGSEKDYTNYIKVLNVLGIASGSRIFDFGCSWGYGSYQFRQAGLDVAAFEIANTRRAYAERELGVRLVKDMSEAVTSSDHKASYDCFFSAHVLEHIPAPQRAFDYAWQLLKHGGLFVSFTPNGSAVCRKAHADWSKVWGEVHPNFIDDVFLDYAFSQSPRILGSSPVVNARLPDDARSLRLDDLSRTELFFAARKSAESW
jgi:2-polyprenyl-3-methyl-5-hydroxy-6-metoxy-1,4-benzoquinol methylase